MSTQYIIYLLPLCMEGPVDMCITTGSEKEYQPAPGEPMMGFYEKLCLPHLLNCACGLKAFRRQRELVVPQARGRVLEVGFGSGLNLPFYDPDKVEFIWGLEPSEGMRRRARNSVSKSPLEVRWLDLPGEEIPLDDNSVDTVLLTYTLCTIPDWGRVFGGCNLNRPIPKFIEEGGFDIQSMASAYILALKFAGFNYWGVAKQV